MSDFRVGFPAFPFSLDSISGFVVPYRNSTGYNADKCAAQDGIRSYDRGCEHKTDASYLGTQTGAGNSHCPPGALVRVRKLAEFAS